MIGRLPEVSTGRRSKFAVLAACVVVAAVLASQSGRLTDVTTADVEASLPENTESLQVAEAADRFDEETTTALVVARREGGLTDEDRTYLDRLQRRLADRPVPLRRQVGDALSSEDGRALSLPVELRDSDDSDEIVAAVNRLRDLAREDPPDGLAVKVTGGAAFAADVSSVFEDADLRLLLVAGGLVLFLLVLIYRSPIFWMIPFGVVVLSELAARGAAAFLADLGLTVTGQSGGILIVLVFGAATDYALLLVARYREELRRHHDAHEAMRGALERVAPAILASGGTVIAGLLTLLLAQVRGTEAIGPLGAAGIALALAFSLTALPAALILAGRRALWPFVPRVGEEPDREGIWDRVAAWVGRRPRRTWLGAIALLAVLSLGLTRIDATLTQQDWFTAEVEAVEGQKLLSASFPGGFTAPTSVIVPRREEASAVRAELERSDLVVAVDESERGPPGVRLEAILRGDPYSQQAVAQVPELRNAARAGSPDALVGGPTAQEYDLRNAAVRDTFVVPPVALAVVLAILVVLLRAAVAPILVLATVAASNAAAIGLGVLLSELVFGFPALEPTVPLLAFVFLVALGIDYNIFLTTRAREESERRSSRDGMLRALAVTGGVITAAGVVLAGTFTTLAVLPLVLLTQLGVIVAVGVLIDAVIVRSLLLPALACELGERFWWPAQMR
jgi:putative drug exporter of the RND superfamily